MRRRRVIFRSVVLVLALGGALALLLPTSWFSLGLAFLGVVVAFVAVFALINLLSALRDRTPDHEPSGAWWWCELPIDHPYVRLADVDSTWRCTRCGDVRHTPPPRATTDAWAEGESGFPMGYHD
ncbi:hypothetical protein HP550_08550 [Cellulomonas humilata]|uniref:Uncharacterized protein n=1 Tax=Cellulomonas humilata TaxID=144055 RepID=A0A7Y6A266_9CELL|nr:hypothetical protein [Cellulomonas humilata]NUU17297.1 hypothetical protein [Cellulomonas humilata]